MKKTLLAVAVASLLPHAPSLAQESKSTQSNVDDTMVVTANRFEQPKSSTIASTDVVTKEQIEQLQLKTLTDVLKWLPGVQVSNNGGQGQSSSVFIRGHASNHVIVLVNGVRFGSSTTGSANFTSIPLTGVERVELVRGARAAVYGADAIGGVINIITDAGNITESSGKVSAGFGTDKYAQGNAAASGQIGDNAWFKVGVNTESAEGFDATSEDYSPNQPDKDGFRRQDLSLEIGSQLNEQWRLRAIGFYHTSRSEYDGYTDFNTGSLSPIEQDTTLYNISAQLEYAQDNLSSSLTLANNRDETESLHGEFPGSTIATDRFVANWLSIYNINSNVDVLGGIEYLRDSVADSSLYNTGTGQFQNYDGEKRTNYSGYISSIAQFDALSLEASLRHDDNDVYGNFTTWQAGAGYKLNNHLRLLASAGTGFKAPTYNDLYWPDYGNPELLPEESLSYEAGFEAMFDIVDFRVVGYHTEIDNLISYQGRGTELESSNATIKGVEIGANFDTGPLSHSVSVDLLDTDNPVNVAGWGEPTKIESRDLSRRANEVYKWLISYERGNAKADLAYLYQGKRFEDTKNEVELDSYHLFDFVLSYQVTPALGVQGKIANLFDEEYETAANYNTQRRAFYANLNYQF